MTHDSVDSQCVQSDLWIEVTSMTWYGDGDDNTTHSDTIHDYDDGLIATAITIDHTHTIADSNKCQ